MLNFVGLFYGDMLNGEEIELIDNMNEIDEECIIEEIEKKYHHDMLKYGEIIYENYRIVYELQQIRGKYTHYMNITIIEIEDIG